MKYIILLIVFISMTSCSTIKKASSGGLINAKAQVAENLELKAADKIAGIESAQLKLMDELQAKFRDMTINFQAEMKAQAEITAQAIAGIGNKVNKEIQEFKAGGDINQTQKKTTNSSVMISWIFGIAGLIAVVFLIVTYLVVKQIFRSKNIAKEKELEADEWKKATILGMQNEKDFRAIENIIEGKKRGLK